MQVLKTFYLRRIEFDVDICQYTALSRFHHGRCVRVILSKMVDTQIFNVNISSKQTVWYHVVTEFSFFIQSFQNMDTFVPYKKFMQEK